MLELSERLSAKSIAQNLACLCKSLVNVDANNVCTHILQSLEAFNLYDLLLFLWPLLCLSHLPLIHYKWIAIFYIHSTFFCYCLNLLFLDSTASLSSISHLHNAIANKWHWGPCTLLCLEVPHSLLSAFFEHIFLSLLIFGKVLFFLTNLYIFILFNFIWPINVQKYFIYLIDSK